MAARRTFLRRVYFSLKPGSRWIIEFEIDIPLSKPAVTTLQMRLAVALENAPISARHSYIPHRMPAQAYAWLNSALPQGEIDQAIFLWRGGFQPYGNAGQTMQLAAELQNVELDYQANWPVPPSSEPRFV